MEGRVRVKVCNCREDKRDEPGKWPEKGKEVNRIKSCAGGGVGWQMARSEVEGKQERSKKGELL